MGRGAGGGGTWAWAITITLEHLNLLSCTHWSRESSAHHVSFMFETVYTVGYISVLQILNNNESIGIQFYSPDIDSDVAAATIQINNWPLEQMWNICH